MVLVLLSDYVIRQKHLIDKFEEYMKEFHPELREMDTLEWDDQLEAFLYIQHFDVED